MSDLRHLMPRHSWRGYAVVCLAVSVSVLAGMATAADPVAPVTSLPATQPDVVGDRVTFLVTRLAAVEESLKAVEAELKAAGYRAGLSAEQAKRYEQGNELMDRKGGGPMPWDKFYGKTAGAFFYHPTDANTRYLFGNDNRRSLAPVPTAQRPPQLDYFYRANDQRARKAREEAASLAGKADRLLQRRRDLEGQQALLWTKLAAAMVSQRQVAEQPLYARKLKADPETTATMMTAAGGFLLSADLAWGELARLQGPEALSGGYGWLRDVTSDARRALQDGMSAAAGDDAEVTAAARPVLASARRLSVIADSIADASQAAADADAAGDELQQRSSRGLLQAGLLEYAEAVADLDDDVQALASRWRVQPTGEPRSDVPKLPPLPPAPIKTTAAVPEVKTTIVPVVATGRDRSATDQRPVPQVDLPVPGNQVPAPDVDRSAFVPLFDGRTFRGWQAQGGGPVSGIWSVEDGCLVLVGGDKAGNVETLARFDNFELELEFRADRPAGNSGIIYRGGPEYQLMDDAGHPNGRKPMTRCGSDFGLHPAARSVVRPVGEWNQVRLVVQDAHVEHWLNGVKVVEYELYTRSWDELVAPRRGAEPHFGRQRPAPIVLQSLGGGVRFRDIRIRPLGR